MKMTERGEMDVLKRYEIPEDIGRKANEINWKAMFGSLVLAPFSFPCPSPQKDLLVIMGLSGNPVRSPKIVDLHISKDFLRKGLLANDAKVRSFLSMLIFLSANVAGVYLFLVPLANLTLIQTCQHRYCNRCCRGLGGGPA